MRKKHIFGRLLSVAIAALLLLTGIPLFSARAGAPARPAPNGQVFWAADFREASLANWTSGPHFGGGQSAMTVDATVKKPFNVSADGLSATLQSASGDVKAVAGTRVQDVNLAVYNTLYLKYSLTGGAGGDVYFFVHGADDMVALHTTTGVKYKFVAGTDVTDGFIKIPITAADVDGDDLWVAAGIVTNTSVKLNIEYLFLGTDDCAADDEQARWIVDNYAAGKPALETTPARPAANGEVLWAADFRHASLANWTSGPHFGGGQSAMTVDATVKKPFNVSADGLSATLQSAAGDVKAVAGTRVQDVNLAVYNTLYLKYSLTDGAGGDVYFFVHGADDMVALHTTTGVKYKFVAGTDVTGGFIKIPITAADVDGDDLWVAAGIVTNTSVKLNIEYLFLGTAGCALDDGEARQVADNFAAGNSALDLHVIPPASLAADELVFEAPRNTNQTFMDGAMKIALKINDIAKLQARSNSVTLTDGANTLTWNLKNYKLAEGKINYLLLPFNEADDAANFAAAGARLNLEAVTKAGISAENAAHDLEVDILGCEFVNYTELLRSMGVLFYDAASVPSLLGTSLTDGETGKAYVLNGAVHSAEYKHNQIPETFQRMGTEKPLSFGPGRLTANLQIYMRVKLLDPIEEFSWQISSADRADYAVQQRIYSWSYADAPASVKNETGWQTFSSTIAGQGWRFKQDGAIDLEHIQMMRLLAYNRNGAGHGILVDTFYIVDSSVYEGLENLHLYAVSDMDGSNMTQLFKLTGNKPGGDVIDEHPEDNTDDDYGSIPDEPSTDDLENADTGADSLFPAALLLILSLTAAALIHKKRFVKYPRKN